MTSEQLKDVMNVQPFWPFTIHMADGCVFLMKNRDYVSRSPSGRTMIVFEDNESFSILDLLLVTELEVHPQGKPAL